VWASWGSRVRCLPRRGQGGAYSDTDVMVRSRLPPLVRRPPQNTSRTTASSASPLAPARTAGSRSPTSEEQPVAVIVARPDGRRFRALTGRHEGLPRPPPWAGRHLPVGDPLARPTRAKWSGVNSGRELRADRTGRVDTSGRRSRGAAVMERSASRVNLAHPPFSPTPSAGGLLIHPHGFHSRDDRLPAHRICTIPKHGALRWRSFGLVRVRLRLSGVLSPLFSSSGSNLSSVPRAALLRNGTIPPSRLRVRDVDQGRPPSLSPESQSRNISFPAPKLVPRR